MDDSKLLVLLAKVHRKGNKLEDAMLALTKARDMQARWDGVLIFLICRLVSEYESIWQQNVEKPTEIIMSGLFQWIIFQTL